MDAYKKQNNKTTENTVNITPNGKDVKNLFPCG